VIDSTSDSDSDKEIQIINENKSKKQQPAVVSKITENKNIPPTTSNTTTTQPPTTNNNITAKAARKQKATAKTVKRTRSPDSSLGSTTLDSKDLKTNNNGD